MRKDRAAKPRFLVEIGAVVRASGNSDLAI